MILTLSSLRLSLPDLTATDIIAIQETKLSAKVRLKKHLEILEDLFPDYENAALRRALRKGYAGPCSQTDTHVTFPNRCSINHKDAEGRIITLEFDDFFVTQVYTQYWRGLKRLEERRNRMSNTLNTWHH